MIKAVMYRGAWLVTKMLDEIKPVDDPMANRVPVVRARAFISGMFATVHAEKMTLIGYA